MKIRCPRCEKKLSIADKYAGLAIRCPACNRGFNVPKLAEAMASTGGGELDLSTLAAAEARTTQMTEEELAAFQGSAAETVEPGIRICPHCQSKVKAEDPTVEALCSHCWKSIPAVGTGGLGGKKVKSAREVNAFGRGGFYTEIGNAVMYPTTALGSIVTAAIVAFLAAVLPVVLLTGAANVMSFSNVGTAQEGEAVDLGHVPSTLTMIFVVEIIYFSAVGIHVFFDVVRSTGVGEDAAPRLTWSPNSLGKSVTAYLALLVYVSVLTYIVAWLTLPSDPTEMIMTAASTGDLSPLLVSVVPYMIGLLLIAFLIPMYLIGISIGTIGQALNPVNVFKSVGRTHVHYLFLVLIVSVLGTLFQFGFVALLFGWFIPNVSKMIAGSGEGKIGQVALAMLVWGGVMAAFFYGIYVIARLHGLFVRTFRKRLLFGTT